MIVKNRHSLYAEAILNVIAAERMLITKVNREFLHPQAKNWRAVP